MRRIRIMLLALLCVGLSSPLFAVETVEKTTGNNFTANIVAKAFDRYTGDFYIGLGAAEAAYTISKAGRSALTFTGIADGADVPVARANGYFGLASTNGTNANYVGFNTLATTGNTGLSAIATTGGAKFDAALGTAAAQINLTDGTAATTISKITGGYYDGSAGDLGGSAGAYFFVRARKAAFDGIDFTATSGIKAFRVNTATPAFVGVGVTTANEHAVKYDAAIGAAGDGSPARHTSVIALANDTDSHINDMYWDQKLNTLFLCSTIKGGDGASKLMAISKVKFKNLAEEKLVISDIVGSGINPLADDTSTIFIKNTTATDTISILKIRTMQTSTGKWYLIVNGDIGAENTVGNKFYALRYDKDASLGADPLDTAPYLGKIVQNNTAGSALAADFTLDAANNALDGGNTGSLQVGGQVAPWQPAYTASDMEVVGDTVYVSMSGSVRDANNDPGVWASTAMFDKDGVIIGWTAWERVMPSQGATFYDRTNFFAIDAVNNKIWAAPYSAEDEYKKVVRMGWVDGVATAFTANSLPASLYNKFSALTYKNCVCTLDLPALTPGLAKATHDAAQLASIALFGGYEKVCFARTSTWGKTSATEHAQVPTAIAGFAAGANFIETSLPSGAATVRCLGYSRRVDNSASSYFFAGTDKGLWAYCHPTTFAGFNGSTGLTTLAAAPFTDGANSFAWKQLFASDIKGAVTAIDADGTYVYVVEQDLTTVGGFTSKLWRLPLGAVATSMTPVLIAQSGSDEIPANTIFTGFKFITDAQGVRATGAHRGIISTNLGLIQSSEALKNLTTAGNNAPNTWIAVSSSRAYRSLYSPKRVPATPATNDGACHKVFANAFIDAENNWYQNSSYHQFGSNVTMNDTGENTRNASGYINYTNRDMANGTRKNYVDRSMNFWTDGGRRFYTRFNASEWVADKTKPNMLESLPFDAQQWNMSTPYKTSDVETENIHWIENISGLGIILAGTGNGVIALE